MRVVECVTYRMVHAFRHGLTRLAPSSICFTMLVSLACCLLSLVKFTVLILSTSKTIDFCDVKLMRYLFF